MTIRTRRVYFAGLLAWALLALAAACTERTVLGPESPCWLTVKPGEVVEIPAECSHIVIEPFEVCP